MKAETMAQRQHYQERRHKEGIIRKCAAIAVTLHKGERQLI